MTTIFGEPRSKGIDTGRPVTEARDNPVFECPLAETAGLAGLLTIVRVLLEWVKGQKGGVAMHESSDGHNSPVHDNDDMPSDVALRVKALESLLTEKGLVDPAALDAIVEKYEHKVGPHNGARVVARAWLDPAYKERLLEDGTSAIGELGFAGPQGALIVVVENTASVHNMVVCTLCSCYPVPVLGLPPAWYKSAPYRSRAIIDPRGVLRELGLDLPDDTEARVWDSTAEARYLVLPRRPPSTEHMSEEQLASLVTRDAMIGVAEVRAPEARA